MARLNDENFKMVILIVHLAYDVRIDKIFNLTHTRHFVHFWNE